MTLTSKNTCHRQGFTLIELLTVIAIIGLLAAIIIPVTGRVRDSARQAQCLSNMRQFLLAVPMYADDNKGRMPPCYHGATNGEVAYHLAPYLSPPAGLTNAYDLCNWARKKECPSTTKATSPGSERSWRYGYSRMASSRTDTTPQTYIQLSSIPEPSRLLYVIDTTGSGSIRPETLTSLPTDLRQATPRPHRGKVSTGWLDGHVRAALVSTLTRADFTRGTPSYSPSYETAFITTAEYDK
ncbi:hypothetical protein OPIT5_15655 [Opitutaceae bacterium TAV5]|nr:hypothetical protein OPIT5_15655 [Opitutaceae bacterium TAV5]